MAEEVKKDAGDVAADVSAVPKEVETKMKKKKKGMLSRVWNGLFRSHGDDFEKRLQYISKEEAAILARMKRRSQNWRRMAKHLLIFSVLFEVIAVGYAIMTTRALDLNWKMRALRVLPMFFLPGLSFITYSGLKNFVRMCERKDQRTLERLRDERKAKINELKERTNYYATQQLIQRYDTDPAAKAAAATVLASKLGADSGLNVYVGDETKINAPTGKSSDVELVPSSGLRNRKLSRARSNSMDSAILHHPEEMSHGIDGTEMSQHHQLVADHHNPSAPRGQDGGWIARIAALLVGEDPAQCYALICGNCHMHNGLARKEDFPFVTYYCPHCNALNRAKQLGEPNSGNTTPNTGSSTVVSDPEVTKNNTTPVSDGISTTSSPLAAAAETPENDKIVSGDLSS